jgi:hypothetical protein
MAVGSISGSTFNPQAMASDMATKIMKAADTDGSGTLSKSELQAFKDSQGGRGPNVDQLFATYNQSGNGELTTGELTNAIQSEAAKAGPHGAGGPPPGGGPPPSGTKQASGGSGSSTQSADPQDLNGDGTVSAAERLIYALIHPDLSKQASSTAKSHAGTQASTSSGAASGVDLYA